MKSQAAKNARDSLAAVAFQELDQPARLRNTLTTIRALTADENRLFPSMEDGLGSLFSIGSNTVGACFGAIDPSWPRWLREVYKARSKKSLATPRMVGTSARHHRHQARLLSPI
ncbi:MAG: hypothetical protein ACJAZO_002192 [Myxococcota bacterium]|jgi:hypothetical protein